MAKKKQVVAVKLKGDEKGTKVGAGFMNPFSPILQAPKLQFLVRDVIFYMGEAVPP
jgi:hypothetical protein